MTIYVIIPYNYRMKRGIFLIFAIGLGACGGGNQVWDDKRNEKFHDVKWREHIHKECRNRIDFRHPEMTSERRKKVSPFCDCIADHFIGEAKRTIPYGGFQGPAEMEQWGNRVEGEAVRKCRARFGV